MNQCRHLLKLAEAWRGKAAHLHEQFHRVSPTQTQHVVAALEFCAEELETALQNPPPPPPGHPPKP